MATAIFPGKRYGRCARTALVRSQGPGAAESSRTRPSYPEGVYVCRPSAPLHAEEAAPAASDGSGPPAPRPLLRRRLLTEKRRLSLGFSRDKLAFTLAGPSSKGLAKAMEGR